MTLYGRKLTRVPGTWIPAGATVQQQTRRSSAAKVLAPVSFPCIHHPSSACFDVMASGAAAYSTCVSSPSSPSYYPTTNACPPNTSMNFKTRNRKREDRGGPKGRFASCRDRDRGGGAQRRRQRRRPPPDFERGQRWCWCDQCGSRERSTLRGS